MKNKIILLLVFAMILPAEEKAFIRDYTYDASEADSKLTCRTIALEQVKRLILEEVGTYIDSYIEVENNMVQKDIIVSITAGVTETKILDEKWNGAQYYVKAEINVDPDFVAEKLAEKSQDDISVEEMSKLRDDNEAARKEIEKLRLQLSKTSSAQEKEMITKEYTVQVDLLQRQQFSNRLDFLYESGQFDQALQLLDQSNSEIYAREVFFYKAKIFLTQGKMGMLKKSIVQAKNYGVTDTDKIIERIKRSLNSSKDFQKNKHKHKPKIKRKKK